MTSRAPLAGTQTALCLEASQHVPEFGVLSCTLSVGTEEAQHPETSRPRYVGNSSTTTERALRD